MAERQDEPADSEWVEVESAPSIVSLDDSDDLCQSTFPFQQPPLREPCKATGQGPVFLSHLPENTAIDWKIRQRPENKEIESSTSEGHLPSLLAFDSIVGGQGDHATTIADSAASPREFHTACCRVREFLATIAKLAHDSGASRISSIGRICSACQQLSAQAEELEKISESYFNHWVSYGSKTPAVDIPLGPDLSTLVEKLSAQLMQTHGELHQLFSVHGSNASLESTHIPLEWELALVRCSDSLRDTHEVLTEFLPILKAQVKPYDLI